MDIYDLKPDSYEHGKGLVDAFDAIIEHLRESAGVLFVEDHEEIAKSVRELSRQMTVARDKTHAAWKEAYPDEGNLEALMNRT